MGSNPRNRVRAFTREKSRDEKPFSTGPVRITDRY